MMSYSTPSSKLNARSDLPWSPSTPFSYIIRCTSPAKHVFLRLHSSFSCPAPLASLSLHHTSPCHNTAPAISLHVPPPTSACAFAPILSSAPPSKYLDSTHVNGTERK
mmetsp:Transcript_14582/g.24867  ORF Transcript_14582/g.24867 Transcript_14582/m.24867 type:complete len:108 (+) Transcript_14582:1058-1381(+)